jgi:hypothetical protein
MSSARVRRGSARRRALAWGLFALAGASAEAQVVTSSPASEQVMTVPRVPQAFPVSASPQSSIGVDQLLRMSGPELDQLYRQSGAAPMPSGKVRGRAIVNPGTRIAVPASKAARVVWQGKVFRTEDSTAINRFFGVKAIKGRLYYAESWLDGAPALILDYRDTSLVYRRYRDEIREVAPGLYLGLMYARTQPQPTLKMYFMLETSSY